MRKIRPLSGVIRLTLILSVFFLTGGSSIASVVTPQPVSDCGQCDGAAVLSLSQTGVVDVLWIGENGLVVFQEFNVVGSSTITDLCTGQYSVQILQGGVTVEIVGFAVNTPGFNAGVSNVGFACSGGSSVNMLALLGPGVTAGGVWTNPQGNVVSAIFSPAASVPGQYTYTVSAGGCALSAAIQMTINQNADPGISTTYLICENYLTFPLLSALFGQPGAGGTWFGPNFEVDDGFYNPETDDSGIFTYMIDNIPGCPAVFSTLFVLENQIPNSGLDAEIAVCPTATPFNMIDQLGGNPQPGGQWFYNMIQPVGPVFDPATSPPGVYRYQVNGSTPCPNTFSFLTISFTDGISAGENNAAAFCESDASADMFALLNGQPDQGGVWTGPMGVVSDGVFLPDVLPSGDYTYTVEAMGCQPVSAVLTLTVESQPHAGQDFFGQMCQDAMPVDLSALVNGNSVPGVIYENGSPLSDSVVDLVSGSHSFQFIVEGNVCPDDNALIQLQIDQPLEPLGAVGADVCSTQDFFDLSIFSSATGLSGIWKDDAGQTLADETVQIIGPEDFYYFVVSSGNACPDDSLGAVITVFEPVFTSHQFVLDFCETAPDFDLTSQLTADELSSGFWADGVNSVFEPVVGNFQYSFIGIQEDSNPCPTPVIDFLIEVDEAPWAGMDTDLTVCANLGVIDLNTFLSTGSTLGGIWSLEDNPTGPLVDVQGLNGTVFSYQVPSNGACPADQSEHEFTVDFGIAFNPGPDLEVCPGFEPVQLGDIPQSGYSYFWFPEDRLDNPFSAQPFISLENEDNLEVSINYSVLVTNGICTFNEDLEVLIHPLPLPDLGPDRTICQGQAVEILATGGSSFQWSANGEPLGSANPLTLNPNDDLSVYVTAFSDFGCTNQDSITVNVLPVPEVLFEVFPYEGCSPLPVMVNNLAENDMPVTYQWLVNDMPISDQPSAEILLETPGEYDFVLVITAENGCSAAQTAEGLVTVFGQPTAFFTLDPVQPDIWHTEVALLNQSTGFSIAEWSVNGDIVSNAYSIVYDFPDWENLVYEVCLKVSNQFDCTSEYCEEILIEGVPAVYVPNAFTPDGDGKNDYFIPVTTGMSDQGYELAIYNRWGEKIFVTDNPDQAWTGNAFGGEFYVQNEVYTWVLKCRENKSGANRVFNGFVTIIR